MMSKIEQYRGLKKAALVIAYDNGLINRKETEEDFFTIECSY